MFLIASVFSSVLAAIPVTVLSAILVAIGFEVFDRWTFKLPIRALRRQPGIDRRHAWQNLCVVALVMVVSATATIVTGAIAGFALSCLIFIVNMTRPIVRRRYSGDEIFSKRRRSGSDMEVLLRTARDRIVLELQGALFFGNADELAHLVSNALKESRMILLDLRAISEIDVSGAAILANLAARLQRQGRTVLFCGLATDRLAEASFAAPGAVFSDLDSGLEWMEEESLRAVGVRVAGMAIPMAELDLVRDLDGGERSSLERLLTRRDFAPGATICREGEAADRMWVLTKGTVSVKVESENGPHRIASLAAGTTVGEMALLETGLRSATVTADEEVSSYELGRDAFDIILRDHPRIAQKLLSYFAREMARRLRLSDRDLRAVGG
jgi:CRP-like cAMP-binding protein/anti-anti-sigma regulatory factor